MQKENQVYFYEQNSWFNCIGDIEREIPTGNALKAKNEMTNFSNYVSPREDLTVSMHASFATEMKEEQEESLKRGRQNQSLSQSDYTQNLSSNQIKSKPQEGKQQWQRGSKPSCTGKQHIYSKNYRQRKKQQVKSLEQQNTFFKKKIQQLEYRLRQMQLKINRLKFTPQQKQYTIEQLNNQFITKVTVIMEKNKQNPAEYKSRYDPTDLFYGEFMETYGRHGLAGSKKMEVMNYYYSEILEAMLRDSERYFCLMCLNVDSGEMLEGLEGYQIISDVFFYILKPDEDKMKRLMFFQTSLHPMVLQLFAACKEFDNKFKVIVKCMHSIHQFMRVNYPSNFDFARMRIIELEAWFEKRKYTKMMRNLREQWLDQLKKHNSEEIEGKKKSNGTKKKKLSNKDQ